MKHCDFCGNLLSDAQYLLISNVVYKSCPNCSSKSNEHIHYFCPEAFGTTKKRATANNPMGLQSHCSQCRGNKEGPHKNAFPCSKVVSRHGHIIDEVRFLPMSKSVFKTDEDVKRFILETMPRRGGTYYYQSSKMTCQGKAFVLFQHSAKLIGYAVLLETVVLADPLTENGVVYEGYYQFAPESIHFLEKPILPAEIESIDSTFKSFNQSLQKKHAGLLPAIFQIINDGRNVSKIPSASATLPDEIDANEAEKLKEGAKTQITVNAYERNAYAREKCLKHYRQLNDGRLKCEICGFDFGERYGEVFANKIHVHHLIEIASIGEEYEVDATRDLIPICPNCHMVAHSKKPAYTPDEIKEMIK